MEETKFFSISKAAQVVWLSNYLTDPLGRKPVMKRLSALAAALVTLALSAPAGATLFTISVSLDGPQAGIASPATGSATLFLDDVANTLGVSMTYSGLLAAVTNAHIHCCSPPGVSVTGARSSGPQRRRRAGRG
jgi:hypothetical protein